MSALLRPLLSVAGLIMLAVWLARAPHIGADAYAYWAIDPADPYASASGVQGLGAFRYAPPVAIALMPLRTLPFEAVAVAAMLVMLASLVYLGGRWSLAALLLPPVLIEVEFGNIDLLIAAAVIIGFRWPAAWAFVLLTKVTPGVGLLWFAVRREWRSLGIALGATALLCAVSYSVRPDFWPAWIGALLRAAGHDPVDALWLPIPLWIRLPAAALIVIVAARIDRRWPVLFAAFIALPTVWLAAAGMLVGLSRLDFRWHIPSRQVARPFTSKLNEGPVYVP